ncbi:hypothetical protein PYW07_013372 [Mythimna separata]|uniref:NADP-dependent oxidoreductase domain-containing protein n=1 Tax=Mythimna separata TaxID=271217 RepID=A0AAD8DJY0_MYTSE|nr:hypothetical protein PYW07_013372 [Mythimna separata]
MKNCCMLFLAMCCFTCEKTALAKLSTIRTTTKITTLSEETYQKSIPELTTPRAFISTTARPTTTKITTPIVSVAVIQQNSHESTTQSNPYISTQSRTTLTKITTAPTLSGEANEQKIEELTAQSTPSVSTTAKSTTTGKPTTPLLSEEVNYGKIEQSTVQSKPCVATTSRRTTSKVTTAPKLSEEANYEKFEEVTVQSTPSVSTTSRTITTKITTAPILSEETNHGTVEEVTVQSTPEVSTTARTSTTEEATTAISEEAYQQKIEELKAAKTHYGRLENMLYLPLADGHEIPVMALGTALMDPRLLPRIIGAAIDMGYRAIDTAYIYGNEKEIGQGIKAKIDDGTVKREDLFIISKLWSTFHRTDLVEQACNASLTNLGLSYFDLYLIHNPMSFKEGSDPIPKIASVVQYSQHDFLDAWYGMEGLVSKGLAKSIGVSNFNAQQIQRILDKGTLKPVVNQIENHPYLTQQRLDRYCSERNIILSCYGVLGSKGTPDSYKNSTTSVIDDALVKVIASGLDVSPAQLLIRYQIERGHNVVVKASSAAHLWDNLQALTFSLDQVKVDALNALNRNKRTFVFKGMGDTHRNYPFLDS